MLKNQPSTQPLLSLIWVALLTFGFQFQGSAQGNDTLATWELTGINITTPAWGLSPLPAQNTSSAISTSGWTRGSGVLLTAAGVATTGSPAGNAWGGNGWDAYTTGGAGNFDSTVSRGDFVTIAFTVASGATVSFTSIPAHNIRRSSTGPSSGQWQYSLGASGTFVNIGSPITWGVTTGTGILSLHWTFPPFRICRASPGVQPSPSGSSTWVRLHRAELGTSTK